MHLGRLAVVLVLGIVLYLVLRANLPSGAANYLGVVYLLMTLRVYQVLGKVWPTSQGASG